MKSARQLILLIPMLFTAMSLSAQQGSIGMGTETPNSNAVLELVSPNNNQGLLVPRMTTAQRTDAAFIANLSSVENSLLVYDTDLNQFFFWVNDDWMTFSQSSNTQNLSFDDQTFQLSIDNGNTVDLSVFIDEYDSDSTNELQTITFSNDTLFLSGDGGSIGIDTSSTNEIQDLSLSGTTLTITNNTSATAIDLSSIDTDTDEQTLSYDSASSTLSISNGNSVELSDLIATVDGDSTNEIQSLTFDEATSTLSISDGNDVDLSTWISENDSDSTNEIQDLQIASDVLSITNNTSATNIDLTSYLDNTDEQTLSLSGTDLSITSGNSVSLAGFSPRWSLSGGLLFYNSGNVGIGTSTPDKQLHLFNGTTSSLIEVEGPFNTAGEGAGIRFTEEFGTDYGFDLFYESSTNELKFRAVELDAVTVDDIISMDRSTGDVTITNNILTPPSGTTTTISGSNQTLTAISERTVIVESGADASSVTRISAGQDGQELVIIGGPSGIGTLTFFSSESGDTPATQRIKLAASSRSIGDGDILTLMYVSALGYWMEKSYANNFWDVVILRPGGK
ncbi:MAG: hypothetical protein NXI20_10405 [bacterium]|nr:hypothetical protein [bacterium]